MYESIPNVAGVYLITCTVTGKVYVGSARRMRSRIQRHRTQILAGEHHSSLLQRAWDKYGASSFVASVIEVCEVSVLRAREQGEIDARGAAERERGYNINPSAAPGRCMPHREETKRKIGAANRGKGGASRRGIPRPVHVVEAMAGRLRGTRPPQHVMEAAWAASRGNRFHLGHRHDAATRARMSEKTRGERHPRAVLTEGTVREVRRLRADGMSGPAIARRFGVHNSSIYLVLNGKTWRHLEEARP
jgi:group I intron endonuclease